MEIRARHKVIIQCDPDIISSSNVLHFLSYDMEQNPSFPPAPHPPLSLYKTCRAALLLKGISPQNSYWDLGLQPFLVIWEHSSNSCATAKGPVGIWVLLWRSVKSAAFLCRRAQTGYQDELWYWHSLLRVLGSASLLDSTEPPFICDPDIQHSFLLCSTVTLILLMEVERELMSAEVKWINIYF